MDLNGVMIKGKKKEELSMDSILSKVSDFQIYSHYMPYKDWELNQVTNSPFCEDKNPSFLIGNKFGGITHVAFNDPHKRGDCFSFVKQLFNLSSLNDVLEKIDFDLGLGIRGIEKDYKSEVSKYEQPITTKRNTLIQVVSRKFTKEELQYWNEYHQDITDLRDNDIYSIKSLYLNKKKFPLKETEIRFGYYHEGGYWKIYFPFAKNKKFKWIGNVPLQTSWGLNNLNKDHNSLIAKSRKDYMVCRKVIPYVCGVQNESLAAFSEEFVQELKANSKVVYYGSDSDVPGKKASYAITQAFGFKHINPEDRLLPDCNDFACWGKTEGLGKLKEHFIKKGLYD